LETDCLILLQTLALIATEILFIFPLKIKRLQCKAGIAPEK